MSIGTVIREKRKQMGFTQEQIGNYLGVSTPAVNKWEKGITYPDIALLPSIARLLNIDLNTLFDFNETLSKEEIQLFSKRVIDIIAENGFEQGFTMSMEKIKEYPNCTGLIHSLALLLDGALIMQGYHVENKKDYEEQIINLYERLAGCEEEEIRTNAIFMLASKYNGKKEYEKSQEMIDKLPERSVFDKSQLQVNLFISKKHFNEATKILEHRLLNTLYEVQMILSCLAEIKLEQKDDEAAVYLAQIVKEVVNLFGVWEYLAYFIPLKAAITKKDINHSLEVITSLFASLTKSCYTKENPLFSSLDKGYEANYGIKIIPSLIEELKNNPEYEFLHSDLRFTKLMKQYDENKFNV